MNVLITGSSGFIGSNLLKKFKNNNHNVCLYNKQKPRYKLNKNIKFLKFNFKKMNSFLTMS